MRTLSIIAAVVVAAALSSIACCQAEELSQPLVLAPQLRAALDRITPNSLRGSVSFLASDLLRGRGTPSKELDVAAEFIASQFRAAGLEPIGDDDYFQTADWRSTSPDPGDFSCELKVGDGTIRVGESQVSGSLVQNLKIAPTAVVKVDAANPSALQGPKSDEISGKVVLARIPHPGKVERGRRQEVSQARVAFFLRMADLKPALVVDVDPSEDGGLGLRQDSSRGRSRPQPPGPPVLTVHSSRLAEAFDQLPTGPSQATFSIQLGEPKLRIRKARNVVGLLRGSDPALKETYVMLSAHYDHLGVGPQNASGDSLFNGANDNASGSASVIAIASALSSLENRPKRSIVFVAFYGEEFGMIGSQYYASHPAVPLDKTVAAINLEQVGRTDDSEGPRVSEANVTGFDFSEVGQTLRRAGEAVGVAVTKHPMFSDRYFSASDNLPLAKAGIPAHTISVAYDFPDYHASGDAWDKLDYANMAKVDKMAALGLFTIANDSNPPKWDETNTKTKPFRSRSK